MQQVIVSGEMIKNLILSNFPVNDPPIMVVKEGIYESVHGGVFVMEKAFYKKHWDNLDLLLIEEEELSFSFLFFTPEARNYYFPGLMLSSLDKNLREKQSNLICSFIDSLDIEYHYHEGLEEYLLGLNRKQENTVARFLLYLVNERHYGSLEAIDALEHYWDMYL
jgi:hypothetical protein